jgi:hypothetical protein
MYQISDWLKKLGMSEYAQRFAENDIDFTVLYRCDAHAWRCSAAGQTKEGGIPAQL